jgi:putative transposase
VVKDPKEYAWSSYRVYAYGKADGVTDKHEIYDAMGKESRARQRAYREYVCLNREREEQEIREKMARGVIGAEIYQEKIEKRVMEARRARRGRPRK